MDDTWTKFNTWIHVKEMLILIFAILIFVPVIYFLLYPTIGIISSMVIYFAYLIVVALLIGLWAKKKLEK